MQNAIGPKLKRLSQALTGLRAECVRDIHLHVAGVGHEHDVFETTSIPWLILKCNRESTYLPS